MNPKLKLIVADDHLLFIDGLRRILNDEPTMEVIALAHDGRQLLEILRNEQPDVVLLDINMPRLNGLEALKDISRLHPSIKVIILSTYHEKHLVEKARDAGAAGYLLKNINQNDLFMAINMVVINDHCFPDQKGHSGEKLDSEDPFVKKFNITKRELEIIQLIKLYYKNQEIADKLYLSIYTVETHRKNIMQKLNLTSPAMLMKFIVENDL